MPPIINKKEQKKLGLALLLLAGIAIGIACLPETVQALLRYDRSSINNGELWRLLTGHFVHTGLNHLVMNIAALLLLTLVFIQHMTDRQLVIQSLLLSVLISAALYLCHPNIGWYVGLSGVLHGIFASQSVRLIRHRDRLGWVLLAACVAKVIIEQVLPNLSGSASLIGASVITEAHAWGVVIGIFIALILAGAQYRKVQGV